MLSSTVLDRAAKPRNLGEMPEATHYGQEGIPGDGPSMQIWLQIKDDRILRATFQTYSCPVSIACGSLVTELLTGRSIASAKLIESRELMAILGGLPEGKEHCAERTILAFQNALSAPLVQNTEIRK